MASLRKRGKIYYASYYVGGHERRRSLETTSYQIARERLRNLEASLALSEVDSQLPTKTPVGDLVEAYVERIRNTKTRNSVRVDTWYLRSIFGPICPTLRAIEKRGRKKRRGGASRNGGARLEVPFAEQVTTAMIAEMIDAKVRQNKLSAKTANRYREILMRFYTWAMDQRGVRMPAGTNPAAKVERRRPPASVIRFLTLEQIEAQLDALQGHPQLQTMVAMYIYAGLRREELLWLTRKDVDLQAGRYGTIRIRAKTVKGEYWEPKTKINRAVPVSRVLRGYLDRYEPRIVPGLWYFPSRQGARWDPDNFSAYLRNVNKKVNLKWSCLDFRHTFG